MSGQVAEVVSSAQSLAGMAQELKKGVSAFRLASGRVEEKELVAAD